jgi:hypothetical protein
VRFIHVVRDGRDMALSSNQNQLRKHGSVIGLPRPELSEAAQSLALWSWLNVETSRYGLRVLGERYLYVKFEDLCRRPRPIVQRIQEFLELSGDPAAAIDELADPGTLGRWRELAPETLAELHRVGAGALAELGYAGPDNALD